MPRPLVIIDRDGTVNSDEEHYLGSSDDWKDKVKILPGVVEGIILLNSAGILPYIATNQSGVYLGLFDEKRMHEVNAYILEELRKKRAFFGGYFACPFVDSAYACRRKGIGKYIDDGCKDRKPGIGMVEKAAAAAGGRIQDFEIIGIGDRCIDLEMMMRAGGKGILIASRKTLQLGDIEKSENMMRCYPGRIYISNDFFDAVKFMLDRWL